MPQLPFEVLKLAFRHLTRKDRLQCQLTCKQWREASTELIYSYVKMSPGFKYLEYCSTISSSPQLANYLKYFVLDDITCRMRETFEKYVLISLIENCPNILDIDYEDPTVLFWTQLIQAANRGKLSRLESLPDPKSGTLIWHNRTALLFSKSLTLLTLNEAMEDEEYPTCEYLPSYRALYTNIKEFINVEHLFIGYCSDKLVSHWDTVIENLPRLKSLNFISTPIEQEKVPSELTESVIPSHKIQQLGCHWNIIKCDDQLKYIMQKFTNLNHLEVEYDAFFEGDGYLRSGDLSIHVMLDFLQYASTIPKISIAFGVRKEDFYKVLVRCLNMLSGPRRVTIAYVDHKETPEQQSMYLTNKSLRVDYALTEADLALPHLAWLSKVGGMIQSLTINTDHTDHDAILGALERFHGDKWICQTIQLCPILQEFTVTCPLDTLFSLDIPFRHNELKSLSVKNISWDDNYSLAFLEGISLMAPNLRSLQLESALSVCAGLKINMPNTSFDLVTLVFPHYTPVLSRHSLSIPNEFIYCIRLKTTMKERFTACRNKTLKSITKEEFEELSSNVYCLNITCAKVDNFFINFSKSKITHTWKF